VAGRVCAALALAPEEALPGALSLNELLVLCCGLPERVPVGVAGALLLTEGLALLLSVAQGVALEVSRGVALAHGGAVALPPCGLALALPQLAPLALALALPQLPVALPLRLVCGEVEAQGRVERVVLWLAKGEREI
jgi:hypothetical protein